MIDMSMKTTTTAISSMIAKPKNYNKFQNIQTVLVQITIPYILIIAGIGLITNILTVMLLSKSFVTKNLKNKWTLIALALSDLLHNITLLIRVILDLIGGKTEYLCMMISFLSNLAELLSACFTVLFTIQRFTAVRFPLQAAVHRRSSPIISLVVIFISSFIFCAVVIHRNIYIGCHEELNLTWFIVDGLVSFIIPFFLILIFNIFIINFIRKHARSPITIQSTLIRHDKHGKNSDHHMRTKKIQRNESNSMTYSDGNTLTSQHTLSETDIHKKLNSSLSLIKSDENNIPMVKMKENKKKPKMLRHISSETDSPANGCSYPMLPNEKVSVDLSSNHHSHSNSPRKLSHLSNDTASSKKKHTLTTQSIRVTRMLVLVSTCFLILNAPAHLCVIALKVYTTIDANVHSEHAELDNFKQANNLTKNQIKNLFFIEPNNKTIAKSTHLPMHDMEIVDDQVLIHLIYIGVLFTQLISYASYSINFFLYSFSGVSFRTSLRQSLRTLNKH